ncbi:MAG: hypothetical protein ACREU6_14965 [Steroidobacteraceae bacterium]
MILQHRGNLGILVAPGTRGHASCEGTRRMVIEFRANAAPLGGGATEDPPFGGLWCDQPAIFLWAESRLRRFQRAHVTAEFFFGVYA